MLWLYSLAVMLAGNGVCAFISPAGISSYPIRATVKPPPTSLALGRSSRRWDTQQPVDSGNGDKGNSSETNGGPFSWVKEAAGRLGRGSSSRTAKKGEADDLLNSEAFLRKKVQMLEKQIKTTQEEIKDAEDEAQKAWDEWGPQIERLEKEFDQLKSRSGEASTKAFDTGKADAINQILVVVDNLERAAGVINAQTDGERAVVSHYAEAYSKMLGCLEGIGLKEVETIGAQFDYNIHNAIMREGTAEFEEDTVCKVFQKGYRIGDTLVRPAMVAVAVPA
ncbi:unnamed protein product [Ascophyllum nodosum]